MALTLTAEQQSLHEVVRELLADRGARPTVAPEPGVVQDPQVWQDLATGVGLAGLLVPTAYGGAGGSLPDAAVVLTALGERLVDVPFLTSSVLSTVMLARSARTDWTQRWLAAVAEGARVVSFAVAEPGCPWAVTGPEVSAIPARGGRWLVSGVKANVLNANLASGSVVTARGPEDRPVWLLVEHSEDTVRVARAPGFDPTRVHWRVVYCDAAAWPLVPASDEEDLSAFARSVVWAMLAAEQLGGLTGCIAMAAEYARTRTAFGQPIGGFQAIKHRLSDMYMTEELATSAVRNAADLLQKEEGDPELAAAVAWDYTTRSYVAASAHNIAIHGAIGFTWEHPAHLYYKRARATRALLTTPTAVDELLRAKVLGVREAT